MMPDGTHTFSPETVWSRFTHLPELHPAVSQLAKASRGRLLERNAILVEEADEDTDMFLVAAGRLRTVRRMDDGDEVWLADAGPGELVGELAALTGQRRTSTVTATSRVQVFAIDREAFLSIAEKHGNVGLALARLLAARLIATTGHMSDLAGKTVIHRVHRELVRLGTPSLVVGELVRLAALPTTADLRKHIHAGREATSRAISELKERGVAAYRDGAWVIADLVGE